MGTAAGLVMPFTARCPHGSLGAWRVLMASSQPWLPGATLVMADVVWLCSRLGGHRVLASRNWA